MISFDSLPKNPGCYLYKDIYGKIIYVGKAKNLKKRVSSYFQKKDHDSKTLALVSHIDSVDFIITNNEIEALILENNLIKRHKPKYNIDLKDSKRYAYIKITNETFPRIITARKIENDGGDYYGPFVSGQQRNHLIELLKKTFKLRTCKRLPKKACLRYHINLCDAPCINNISEKDYNHKIEEIRLILKNNHNDLIKKLENDMKKYSSKQNFEKALLLRDRIDSISYLKEHQNVERKRKFNEDIINYVIKDNRVYLILFNIYKGVLAEKNEFVFENNHPDFLEEFIVQYYSDLSNKIPKELILPSKIDQSIQDLLENIKKNNSEIYGKETSVTITIPKIGEKKELLNLVKKNIEISFFGNLKKVEELHKKLKLNDVPYVIECFDISHLSGTSTVASMVQFRNGKPDKNNYRRFKIRTVEGIDDFESMNEVIMRRYKRLRDERLNYPNLIIIDGGKGQLSSAINSLKKLGVNIPIISVAKKFEEIFFPGSKFPLVLDHKETALKFIQEIRDEAHRFAITYNRLLRKKAIVDEFKEL
jgi:excinuclease ABC subunit C